MAILSLGTTITKTKVRVGIVAGLLRLVSSAPSYDAAILCSMFSPIVGSSRASFSEQ